MCAEEPTPHRKNRETPLEDVIAPFIFIAILAVAIVAAKRLSDYSLPVAALEVIGVLIMALGALWLLRDRR